ncbi:MAG TPA: CRISPR-associated endonuclease Cas2 [Rhodocyclaceae bacterium]|nr:CRISPR-associated endonuclease Cas2 [Rhodocyclaceae bacterium]
MRLWVVAYDVADGRRRRRLAHLLGRRLERVQESVFEGWLGTADMRTLLADAAALIEPGADAVRAYPVACREPGRRRVLGPQPATTPLADYWIA